MNDHIIRNCVLNDRLASHLSEYYYRRVRGVCCPDLLLPDERANADSRLGQRLESARLFVQGLQVHQHMAG